MGAGQSVLQEDEKEALSSFTSGEVWSFDSEKWQALMRWKVQPHTLSGSSLRSELKEYSTRLVSQRASRNVATLGAHIALRLPKAWFFSRTDVWMTTTAVTILRVLVQHLFATLPYADALAYLTARPHGPAGTPVLELESYTWTDVVSSCLDYLAAGTVDAYQYDLHVAVLELLLVLMSPQAARGEPLLRGVEEPEKPRSGRPSAATVEELSADAAVDAALQKLRTGEAGEAGMADAYVRAAMILGSYQFDLNSGLTGSVTSARKTQLGTGQSNLQAGINSSGGVSAGPIPKVAQARQAGNAATVGGHPFAAIASAADAAIATRAHVVCRGLLRNVAVDGGRTDDSDAPGPTEGSAANRASLAVMNQRQASLKAHEDAAASGGAGSGAGGVADAALSMVGSVLTAAGSVAGTVASLPVSLVTDVIAPGPGEPVGKPLAERSALLLLLLLHNCRTAVWPLDGDGNDGSAGANGPGSGSANGGQIHYIPNPYRAALLRRVDSGAKECGYEEAANAQAVLKAFKSGSGMGSAPLPSSLSALSRDSNLCVLGLPFKQLFSSLTDLCSSGPLGTSLLYTLQHGCPAWQAHSLSRTDIDLLLLPILGQLYRLEALPHDDRYLALITLMMFTQDAAFCETAFKRIKLNDGQLSKWYRDSRRLGEISLGSLMMLVLLRTAGLVCVGLTVGPAEGAGSGAPAAGTPTASAGAGASASAAAGLDPQALSTLLQNIFAACANLAPYAENLHQAACQRALTTLSGLHKRHRRFEARLTALMAAVGAAPDATTINLTPDVMGAAAVALGLPPSARPETVQSSIHRATVTSDMLAGNVALLTESLLACTAPTLLPRNTQLLYTLLRERTVVETLAADPLFESGARPLADLVHHVGLLVARAEADKALQLALSGSGGAAEVTRIRDLKEKLEAGLASSTATANAAAQGIAPTETSSAALAAANALLEGSNGASSSGSGGGNGGVLGLGIVPWEEADVLAVLQAGMKTGIWPGSRRAEQVARASMAQIFEYKEAPSPESFFVPYLWCMAYGYCRDSIGWTAADVRGAAASSTGSIPTIGVDQEGAPGAAVVAAEPPTLFVFPPGHRGASTGGAAATATQSGR